MFRFSSLFSVFCAGCFCTLTVQQVPAWSEAALPRTQAIAPDVSTTVRDTVPLSAPPVSTAAAVPVCTTESAAAVPPPTATPLTTAPPLATSGTSLETTTETTATTTSTGTTVITTETTAVSTEAPQTPPETDSFFQEYDTAFKAYMDYRTITDTSSEQYAIQQNAWTDSRGLRRSCDDYLVAMGTGWLTEGCGDRFQVTLESGSVFTVRVGDIKADQHTDSTHRYRSCADGANVLEFIVETESLSDAARTAGTVSVYPELSGNIAAIEPISTAQ